MQIVGANIERWLRLRVVAQGSVAQLKMADRKIHHGFEGGFLRRRRGLRRRDIGAPVRKDQHIRLGPVDFERRYPRDTAAAEELRVKIHALYTNKGRGAGRL